MKLIKSLLVIAFVFSFANINAQVLSQRAQQHEDNEVEVLTKEEQWDLQIWFNQELDKMNLDEETKKDYEAYFLMYVSRMMRLDDKDKGLSKEEILVELDKHILEMNTKMKEILPEDAYKQHMHISTTLFGYVKIKLAQRN